MVKETGSFPTLLTERTAVPKEALAVAAAPLW